MKFASTLATPTFEAMRPNPLPETIAVHVRSQVYKAAKILNFETG
jgi:hypothetical protein